MILIAFFSDMGATRVLPAIYRLALIKTILEELSSLFVNAYSDGVLYQGHIYSCKARAKVTPTGRLVNPTSGPEMPY